MEKLYNDNQTRLLQMANEDHYRKQAEFYRNSPEYTKMKGLYPKLQSSINDCLNEKFID